MDRVNVQVRCFKKNKKNKSEKWSELEKKYPFILKCAMDIPAVIDGEIPHVYLIFSIFPKALDISKNCVTMKTICSRNAAKQGWR